jgi:DNA-binding NarL/FixJ family response regulator
VSRVILIIEDGTEYLDAFRRLADAAEPVEWLHAADAGQARDVLARRRVDAVFLDVVFDRTAPERLAGGGAGLDARFPGDPAGRLGHLARQQGFYVLRELAASLPRGSRVVLAHDFTDEPARLAALREAVPRLEGVAESATATEILRLLLAR